MATPSEFSLQIAAPIGNRARPLAGGRMARGAVPSPGWIWDGDGTQGIIWPGDGSEGGIWDGDGSQSGRLVVGLGYHSDTPDQRDYSRADAAKSLRAALGDDLVKSALFGKGKLEVRVDLRKEFKPWPVQSQGRLYSCTAHAVTSLMQYMVWRGCRKRWALSRMFLYNVSRRLLGWSGDSGASLRAALKAAETCGVPEEQYWPYMMSQFDVEPDAFLYSFGHAFRPLLYTRLDDYGASGADTLELLRRSLSDRIPVAFGFPVSSSIDIAARIAIPDDADRMLGGHAVLAVGYTKEAIIFRNSWGRNWGDEGYGYLPVEYVQRQWATDFWTILRPDWVKTFARS